MPHTPSTAHALNHPLVQQMLDSGLEKVGDGLLSVDIINDEEIFRAE